MNLLILAISSVMFSLVPKLPILASRINPEPLFQDAKQYTTTLTTNGDIADIYHGGDEQDDHVKVIHQLPASQQN